VRKNDNSNNILVDLKSSFFFPSDLREIKTFLQAPRSLRGGVGGGQAGSFCQTQPGARVGAFTGSCFALFCFTQKSFYLRSLEV